MKNCIIENNDQGLRFQNADVTVENNTIRDNRHGVVAINAGGLFTGNSIYNNDRDGKCDARASEFFEKMS